MQNKIIYRKVIASDFNNVCKFVDNWLSGRRLKEGGGNDYFVSRNQHSSYFKTRHVWIALDKKNIIAWAVKERSGVLIHLLVDARYRGKGIGTQMMNHIKPQIIRSKTDQMTGDPKKFYEKNGYKSMSSKLIGRKKNIELMSK